MASKEIDNLPKTIKEAKAAGVKHYFTGKECHRGHLSPRFVSTRKCMKCSNLYCKDRYEKNPDYFKRRARDWYNDNHEYALERMVRWRANNREISRKAASRWARNNSAKVLAIINARRARLLQAIPAWADLEAIKKIYEKRKQISLDTGILHHVDHIVPLKGKTVCGLHVENNLRIIPAVENLQKQSKLVEKLLGELDGKA